MAPGNKAPPGAPAETDLLHLLTCGGVDDGKSTLIGRLLYESETLSDDQLADLKADSRERSSVSGDEIDFSLLVDGLQAEREQGITIDVAYRYLTMGTRRFVIADAPGHEQYTRNMATAASTADVAVVLVDAGKGVLTQTRRHTFIAALLGVRHVVLAINKMDRVRFDQGRFDDISTDYHRFARELDFQSVTTIPVSARLGDNVCRPSTAMAWYDGPPLTRVLADIEAGDDKHHHPLRFPVQWVNRAAPDFRGFCGTVASGKLRADDLVAVFPSSDDAHIARIVTADGDRRHAVAGDAITIVLDRDIDIGRGDVITHPRTPPTVSDQFQAHVIWMSRQPMLVERSYEIKFATRSLPARVTRLKRRIDVNTLAALAANTLEMNDLGVCNFALEAAIAFDPYAENRAFGGFLLIDRLGNETVGAGMIDFGLRRATNLTWHDMHVDKTARARLNRQKPCVLWFTGLSGSGKSTIADRVEKRLHAGGHRTYLLDGDNVRQRLNKDLGFTDADRVENIRRVAEVARLFVDAGLIVLVAFISPFRNERHDARALLEADEFLEIHVDATLAVCERRDPKGLYAKARRGDIDHFTGITSPYEVPENPEITVPTGTLSPEQAENLVMDALRARGLI